jgi:hypothetical protein
MDHKILRFAHLLDNLELGLQLIVNLGWRNLKELQQIKHEV